MGSIIHQVPKNCRPPFSWVSNCWLSLRLLQIPPEPNPNSIIFVHQILGRGERKTGEGDALSLLPPKVPPYPATLIFAWSISAKSIPTTRTEEGDCSISTNTRTNLLHLQQNWNAFGENCSISSKSIPGTLNFVFIFGENCKFLFRFLPI